MRRTAPVLAATTACLALLASFHTSPGSTGLAASTAPGTGAETVSTEATSSDPTSSSGPSSRTGVSGASVSRSSTTSSIAPRAAPTSAPASRSIDGPVIQTAYGPVQVRITVRGPDASRSTGPLGPKIVEVQALQLPSDRAKSQRISAQAGPKLRSEALQAQSAHIHAVSGASYTSDGYTRSLQGALDSAGL